MNRDELLLENLPSFMKQYDNLTSYVEAVGEFLDETEEAIVNLSNSHNYYKVGNSGLDMALNDLGFNLPSNVTEKTKRQLLRDGIHLILKSGTEDSLLSAFRLIGIGAQLQEAWAVSPTLLDRGLIFDFTTGNDVRYDLTNNSYQDMLYGSVEVKEDGVFFSGYEYDDFNRDNPINDIPIHGEIYDKPVSKDYVVGKTPYVLVLIDDSDVNLVTSPTVDPETGEEYTYTEDEKFSLVNDIIQYFVYESNRPAHMRIIVTISPSGGAEYEDSFTVNESYSDAVSYQGESGFSDSSGIGDTSQIDGEVTVSSISVGDPVLIGIPSPYESQFSLINLDTMAETGTFPEVDAVQHTVVQTHYPDENKTPDIPLYGRTSIEFTAPSDSNVEVNGIEYYSEGTKTLINTVSAGQTYSFDNEGQYHLLSFTYLSTTSEDVDITVQYGQ